MGRTIKEVFFKDSNHENLEVADVKARSHRAAMPLNPPYPPFKRGELHGITAKTLPLCRGGSRGIDRILYNISFFVHWAITLHLPSIVEKVQP